MFRPDALKPGMTRRQLLAALGAAGAAGVVGWPERAFAMTPTQATRLAAKAGATAPAGSDLGAVDHIVFLMMENRSYDHYFGAYPRGRGFDDHPAHSLGAFAQPFPGGSGFVPKDVLLPFHLDINSGDYCTNDLTHDWGPMHECWNGGRMDGFVRTHTSSANEGVPDGEMTMGYYTREDLPFYYALADTFTLCDNYHAAILGPTHPNRLMANSGFIDPAGTHGGPITDTNPYPFQEYKCSWTTIQEVLQDAGVSWKVYHPDASTGLTNPKYSGLAPFPTWAGALYDPQLNPLIMLASDHVLPYFTAFQPKTGVLEQSKLYQQAYDPTFPGTFVQDIEAGTLPSVSWVIPPLGFDEHPSASPQRGMHFTSLILDALLSNPKVWSKTALFLMYDENDGWFDHVSPPTAPPGTPGEHLTAAKISSETLGIRTPLGLGVRVPMTVISPFSRGGHIASEVFDHTSQLQLIAARFGVEVPNVSEWRRKTVGDLSSTLFRSKPDFAMPALPTAPLPGIDALPNSCFEVTQDTAALGGAHPSPPTRQSMPTQDGRLLPASAFAASVAADSTGSTAKGSNAKGSTAKGSTAKGSTAKGSTAAGTAGAAGSATAAGRRAAGSTATTKSAFNALADTGGLPTAGDAALATGVGLAALAAVRRLLAPAGGEEPEPED